MELLASKRQTETINMWATGLAGLLCIFCPLVTAQNSPPTLQVDPFILAIEKMKYAVAPLDCMGGNGAESKVLERLGTAFLVSERGDFLTAAHVIREMQKGESACPTTAITLPSQEWHPEARTEQMRWFPFKISDCRINDIIDVAKCKFSEDLSVAIRNFTGFPLHERDPMTFRADVAAYRTPWAGESIPELVLDRAALPGFSGSPVYLADGRVVAILVGNGTAEATGITVARWVSICREMLAEGPSQ